MIGAFAYGWKPLLAIVLLIVAWGFGFQHGEQTVQGRWDTEKLDQAHQRDAQLQAAIDTAAHARAETEAIRANYIDFKAGKERETADLERAVAAGAKRLSVRASCPGTMPQAGAIASGTAGGTAILDADAGRNYYAYRRAYAAQFATLKLCRDELIKRSSK